MHLMCGHMAHVAAGSNGIDTNRRAHGTQHTMPGSYSCLSQLFDVAFRVLHAVYCASCFSFLLSASFACHMFLHWYCCSDCRLLLLMRLVYIICIICIPSPSSSYLFINFSSRIRKRIYTYTICICTHRI